VGRVREPPANNDSPIQRFVARTDLVAGNDQKRLPSSSRRFAAEGAFRSPAPPIDVQAPTDEQELVPTRLEIPSPGLLSFQRFEQRFEIARSETFAAVAADNFIKYRWPVFNGLAENLE